MSRRWIRLHTEVMDDPKVQTLSDKLFKFWINCLCLAGRHNGVIPDPISVAWKLRMSQREVEKLLVHLVENGLLETDGNCFKPHNWNERQYEDASSTERVRRWRNKQKETDVTVTETEVTECNDVSEIVLIQNTETDTDTDTEQNNLLPATLKQSRQRRTQLPYDSLPDEWLYYGQNKYMWTKEHCLELFDGFSDHHRGKGNSMADWKAAWHTWCRNSVKFDRSNAHNQQPREDNTKRAIKRAYELHEQGLL